MRPGDEGIFESSAYLVGGEELCREFRGRGSALTGDLGRIFPPTFQNLRKVEGSSENCLPNGRFRLEERGGPLEVKGGRARLGAHHAEFGRTIAQLTDSLLEQGALEL